MTPLPLLFASDHAGYALKELLKTHAESLGYTPLDKGPHSTDSVDYPDYAAALCQALPQEAPKGVLICGSGLGISIAANRFRHIRAALAHDHLTAKLCRVHNDANVLVLGERLIGTETAKDCLEIFLATDFAGGRHQRRVDKLGTL